MSVPNGVRCPVCTGRLETIRVVQSAPGITARRRRCESCGHRLTTHERVVVKEKPLPVAVGVKKAG